MNRYDDSLAVGYRIALPRDGIHERRTGSTRCGRGPLQASVRQTLLGVSLCLTTGSRRIVLGGDLAGLASALVEGEEWTGPVVWNGRRTVAVVEHIDQRTVVAVPARGLGETCATFDASTAVALGKTLQAECGDGDDSNTPTSGTASTTTSTTAAASN